MHVDYKRQLVGSTISQMGFMLVQCALGAYSAAIVHLILHGVFKATLFLQSGSVVKDLTFLRLHLLKIIWLACIWSSTSYSYSDNILLE